MSEHSVSSTLNSVEAIHRERRNHWILFGVQVVCTLAMVAIYYAHFAQTWQTVVAVLAVAGFNAVCVAGFLMHLWRGQWLIHALVMFTGVVAAVMLVLTVFSRYSLPALTQFWR